MKEPIKTIVCVCGEGGHYAEMSKLMSHALTIQSGKLQYLVLSDHKGEIPWASTKEELVEVRDKHTKFNVFKVLKALFENYLRCRKVFKNNQVTLVISTGPAHAFMPALIAKLKGIKVLHVETCARFTTRSLTGRVMYYLADEFWLQNKSLGQLYSKGKYVGLL